MNVTIDRKSAQIDACRQANTADSNHIKAVEFELALGSEDLRANGFEACIENAARVAGFLSLFNLPAMPSQKGQRLAAVASIEDDNPVFVFVALDSSGTHIIVQPEFEDMEHIKEFAAAYFNLMLAQLKPRETIEA